MRMSPPFSIRSRLTRPMGNERGATIVLVAIVMTALLSICALAIDIGMLFNSRSEAQRAADSGALAGASALITEPDKEGPARARAIRFAEMNDVHGETPDVQEADVDVDLANGRVTVRVLRTADRGSSIATWFARVFGVDEVDVSADATAEVAPTGRAVCVKPFAVEDLYFDADENGAYNPDAGDLYNPQTTGYLSEDDHIGMMIVIKGAADGTGPSWSQPWDIPQPPNGFCSGGPGGQGAKCYQEAIERCNPAGVDLAPATYNVENGEMHGPTRKGVNNVISQDPNAEWNNETKTIDGSEWGDWTASPRYGIVPVFDPARVFEPGKQEIEFSNFIGIWFEGVEGNGNNQQVHARVMPALGLLTDDVPPSPTVLGVRLIE